MSGGTIYLSAIVQRREVVDSLGKRLNYKHSGPQRCFILVEGDLLRMWNAGGILQENTQALQELQQTSKPIDSFNLRMVHIQRIPDQNAVCLHFTNGMERLLLIPEKYDDQGRTIETWASIFSRSIRDSILLDQYTTSVFLHTQSVSVSDDGQDNLNNRLLFLPHKSAFDESFSIEYKWPGFVDFQRCNLGVQMKAGWGDSRVVSKRCLCLWQEVNSIKKPIAMISSVTSFHLLSQAEVTVIIEGDAKYLKNDSQIAPLTDRVLIKPLQPAELKRLLLFLRDTFEVLLPRPKIYESPDNIDHCGIKFQTVTMSSSSGDKTKIVKTATETENLFNRDELVNLVKSKPWNQLAWSDLYTFYKLNSTKFPLLSPNDFTVKFKSIGYCLKSTLTGNVLQIHELEDLLKSNGAELAEFDCIAALTPLYWHHIEINNDKYERD